MTLSLVHYSWVLGVVPCEKLWLSHLTITFWLCYAFSFFYFWTNQQGGISLTLKDLRLLINGAVAYNCSGISLPKHTSLWFKNSRKMFTNCDTTCITALWYTNRETNKISGTYDQFNQEVFFLVVHETRKEIKLPFW